MPPNAQAVRNSHSYSPSKLPTVTTISGLLFEASQTHHNMSPIPTLVSQDRHRFPVLEIILGSPRAVHECVVTLLDEDKGVEHRFLVVCQTGSDLQANKAIAREYEGKKWKGCLVAMQMGSRESVVNMTHQRLGIKAVGRFLDEALKAPIKAEILQALPSTLP